MSGGLLSGLVVAVPATFWRPTMALGATPDHRGRGLVSGDVLVGFAPMRITPDAAVGGIDRQQSMPAAWVCAARRLRNTAVGRSLIHGAAEAFSRRPAPIVSGRWLVGGRS